MAEKITLMALHCPNCGAGLKAENTKDPVECMFCDSTVIPVVDMPHGNYGGGSGASVRVEGVRSPSSALAYMEQFFEEYDWEAFAYAQNLSVAEIDKLARAMKASSADDKNTWILCFKAVSVPYIHKIEGCKKILSSVIAEYEVDGLDAYSQFDAYKRVMAMMASQREEVLVKLEKFAAYASKYGASVDESSALQADQEHIKAFAQISPYTCVEDIPQVQEFIRKKDEKIVAQLAERGINAKAEYDRAKHLIEQRHYVEALNILLTLNGYSDTKALINKIDKYYLILDVLEIEEKLYYYMRDQQDSEKLGLYPTENGKIADKPIIKNIGQIITNHADILYYLNSSGKLKRYNLSAKVETKLFDKKLDKESIYVYGRKVFLRTAKEWEDSNGLCDIVVLDLVSGAVSVFIKNAKEIVSLTGNKLVYKIASGGKADQGGNVILKVINVDTKQIAEVGGKDVTIEGFVGNQVVFTRQAPNNFNKNLYIKPMADGQPERLIEQNVYQFCSIIQGKLFYYIGNVKNRSLININCDGTGRREWPLFIHKVLFEQGGWVYFIRKAGYNSILCRSRLDGSKYSIIAADIEEFVEIKNGYLYYINDDSTLVKVRMDGSNLQELCDDVEAVLSVREDKIVFVSIDGRISSGEYSQTSRIVKSIYAVDFTGSGKIKLAYDIKRAKEYDENAVYYIAERPLAASSMADTGTMEELYKLDVATNRAEKLLDLQVQKEPQKFPGLTIAIVVAVVAFFCALIAFCAESMRLGLLFLLTCIIAAIIAVVMKFGKET